MHASGAAAVEYFDLNVAEGPRSGHGLHNHRNAALYARPARSLKHDQSESSVLRQVLLIPETTIRRHKDIEPRGLSDGDQVPVAKG